MHFFVNCWVRSAEFYLQNAIEQRRLGRMEFSGRMNELTIEVTMEGQEPTVFRFADPIVRVGRGQECELRLCHEAVPRRLGSFWLDPGTRCIHLEPHPRLSNPLLWGQTVLVGPVSGRRLELSIGPLNLCAYACEGHREARCPKLLPVIALGCAIAGILGSAVINKVKPGERSRKFSGALLAATEATPLCPGAIANCGDRMACQERARLALSRANEILARSEPWSQEAPQALRLLEDSCLWLRRLGEPEHVEVCARRDQATALFSRAHKTRIVSLKAALAASDHVLAARLAEELAALVDSCSPGSASTLRQSAREWKGSSK